MTALQEAPPTAGDPEPRAPVWQRREDIQGLRALAVLVVVAYHVDRRLPGGFIGVDVFFVVSGFVITGMLANEHATAGDLSLGRFFAKRVRRILPALALMVSTVAALGPFMLSPLGPLQQTIDTGQAATLIHANVQLSDAPSYFSVSAEWNALLHTWSLSVEEQFYLVFPILLVWLMRRSRGEADKPVVALFALAGASFVLSIVLTGGGLSSLFSAPTQTAFYSSASRAWEFLAGAILALVAPRIARFITPAVGAVVSLLGVAAVVLATLTYDDSIAFPGFAAVVPVVGTLAIIAGGFGGQSHLVGRGLSSRAAIWLGDRSYAWYLWHWPAIVAARSFWPESSLAAPLAAGASLALAAGSYRLVENPLRHGRGPRTAALAALCVLGPLALLQFSDDIGRATRSAEAQALVASQALHADVVLGCDSTEPFGQKPPACTWTVPNSSGTVVLLGDSNAGHFTEPLQAAANGLGYDFSVATSSGCPFVDVLIARSGEPLSECRTFVSDSMAALTANPPTVVVLASSDSYLHASDVTIREAAGQITEPGADRVDAWAAGLESTLGQLVDAGASVSIVQTIPHLPWDPLDCGGDAIRNPSACRGELDRSAVAVQRAASRSAIEIGTEGLPVLAVELEDAICGPSSCRAFRDGFWQYRDGGHLSVLGATLLTAEFSAVLTALAPSEQ